MLCGGDPLKPSAFCLLLLSAHMPVAAARRRRQAAAGSSVSRDDLRSFNPMPGPKGVSHVGNDDQTCYSLLVRAASI